MFWGKICPSGTVALVFVLISPAHGQDYTFVSKWPNPSFFGYFDSPHGIACDGDGNIYVTDDGNKVSKLSPTGQLLRVWTETGQQYGEFTIPTGIAITADGGFYVADPDRGRVSRFDRNGNFIRYLDPRPQSGLIRSDAICIDELGNVYVSDGGLVLKYNSNDILIATLQAGAHPDQLNFPTGMVTAGSTLFVCDANQERIAEFNTDDNSFIRWWPRCCGEYYAPMGIATDNEYLYVTSGNDNQVLKFDLQGNLVCAWGSEGFDDGDLLVPHGIAVDNDGNVLVTSERSHRVQKYANSGLFISRWGAIGTNDGEFHDPAVVALSPLGDVYVADKLNHRIQRFTRDGAFVCKWGEFGGGDGQFNEPQGLAVDADGYVYVSDTLNHRIQKFSPEGQFIRKWGLVSPYDFSSDRRPEGIAFDSRGLLLVADSNNDSVKVYTRDGALVDSWIWFWYGFKHPSNVTVDSGGRVYVSEYSKTYVLSATGAKLAEWPYLYVGGADASEHLFSSGSHYAIGTMQLISQEGVTIASWGSQGWGDDQVWSATSYASDLDGYVYVADSRNQRIQKFAPDDHLLPSVALITLQSAAPTRLNQAEFLVTFSENVSGVETSDFAVTASGPIGATVLDVSGAGRCYRTTVATGAGDGVIRLDVRADATIRDAQLNALQEGYTGGPSCAVDKTNPTVAIQSSTNSPTNLSPIPLAIRFSEPVLGFGQNQVSVENGTVDGLSGSGFDYNLSIIPSQQGKVSVSVSENVCFDAAQNPNAASAVLSIEYDLHRPSAVITSTVKSPTNRISIPLLVTFDREVHDFTLNDIEVIGGVVPEIQTISDDVYSLTLMPQTQGNVQVVVKDAAATSSAGNASTVSMFGIVHDSVPPQLTILGDNPARVELHSSYFDSGATAFDTIDGDVTSRIVVDTSDVDINATGSYHVMYSVADRSGNSASDVIRAVYVEAAQPTIPISSVAVTITLLAAGILMIRNSFSMRSGT